MTLIVLPVIASAAKQSIVEQVEAWIASSLVLLAMTADVFANIITRPPR
jgi:hypothetical protein